MHTVTHERVFTTRRVALPILLLALSLIGLYTWSLPGRAWAAHHASNVVVNVRDKGAKGDGVHDDTTAIQSAIDSLPARGGTVVVPPGTYMIDAMNSIVLRSNMALQLANDATIKALPNSSPRSYMIKVWHVDNVSITGGNIVGERQGHTGKGGEWGYGINIQGSNHVHVSNVHISDCWGDGMWIGALGWAPHDIPSTDVVVENIVSTHNRRQGLSIGPVNGVTISNSTFSNTQGTMPQSGIDIEPQTQGHASNITIDHCTMVDNRGSGLEVHSNVSNVTVKNCSFTNNYGYGVLTVDAPTQVTIINNTVIGNGLAGLSIAGKSSYVRATGNTLGNNSARYPMKADSPQASNTHFIQGRQLEVKDSASQVTASGNTYAPQTEWQH
ncbi:MAG TPA: right-handed parallel beta-helix repeat-containing protein [Dyella sp.]|uniref:right-handed parallel beta-helix repeat-containing protein n=1 Tax=Dyella sp. TaxID=1869338 RepID=UPI002C64062B|nr:right-handed parallel beta-helix repeat-containing protein [Dyella sp.]HUB89683.1 right-handed parallel beta-helix repeat-containing protein [Dyella sp.]